MTLAVTFLIVFLVGPTVFRWLARPSPTAIQMWRLLGISVLAVAVAFGLHLGGSDSLWRVGAVVAALWLAWIGVLALLVLALRRHDPRARMQRWTQTLGAAATTAPWFGLVLADVFRGP